MIIEFFRDISDAFVNGALNCTTDISSLKDCATNVLHRNKNTIILMIGFISAC